MPGIEPRFSIRPACSIVTIFAEPYGPQSFDVMPDSLAVAPGAQGMCPDVRCPETHAALFSPFSMLTAFADTCIWSLFLYGQCRTYRGASMTALLGRSF